MSLGGVLGGCKALGGFRALVRPIFFAGYVKIPQNATNINLSNYYWKVKMVSNFGLLEYLWVWKIFCHNVCGRFLSDPGVPGPIYGSSCL